MRRLPSRLGRLFVVSTVIGWKLVAAAALLVAVIESLWITFSIIPGLEYGPIDCNVVNCDVIGVQVRPQPLFYVSIGITVIFGVAGLGLLAYILSLLEKRLAVRDDFVGPSDEPRRLSS